MNLEFESTVDETFSKVWAYAQPFLSECRIDWDEPHTLAVQYYAVQIAKSESLDVLVMGTTGLLHDIGWFGLFKGTDSKNYEVVKSGKAQHMLNGVEYSRTFMTLDDIKDRYTEEQKIMVLHLVGVHDKLEELTTKYEISFMEADTLGAIDVAKVKPTFDRVGAEKYLAELFRRRYPKFSSSYAITAFNTLLPAFKAHFERP